MIRLILTSLVLCLAITTSADAITQHAPDVAGEILPSPVTLGLFGGAASVVFGILWRVWREIRDLLEAQDKRHNELMANSQLNHVAAIAANTSAMDRMVDRIDAGNRELRDAFLDLALDRQGTPARPRPPGRGGR